MVKLLDPSPNPNPNQKFGVSLIFAKISTLSPLFALYSDPLFSIYSSANRKNSITQPKLEIWTCLFWVMFMKSSLKIGTNLNNLFGFSI